MFHGGGFATVRKGGLVAGLIAGVVLMAAGTALADSEVAKIARGGQLYDTWYELADGLPEKGTHPKWNNDKQSGKSTWRCKSCHGWDYVGADGDYADKDGKYYTGYKGIAGAAGTPIADLVALFKDANHGYTNDHMSDSDFEALALFVAKGQTDMLKVVGADGKLVSGDAAKGEGYYLTICVGCHGKDGKKITDMPPVGKMAALAPQQAFHRIRFGKPGAPMPGLVALPVDVSADVLSYAVTLPQQ